MHAIGKLLAAVWVGVLAVAAGHFAGVSALAPLATPLLTYGTLVSPLPVLGGVTVLYGLFAWGGAKSRKKLLTAEILRDKPGLVNDKTELARARHQLAKRMELERKEAKTRRREYKAERRIRQQVRLETKLQRKREALAKRRMALRRHQPLGP